MNLTSHKCKITFKYFQRKQHFEIPKYVVLHVFNRKQYVAFDILY